MLRKRSLIILAFFILVPLGIHAWGVSSLSSERAGIADFLRTLPEDTDVSAAKAACQTHGLNPTFIENRAQIFPRNVLADGSPESGFLLTKGSYNYCPYVHLGWDKKGRLVLREFTLLIGTGAKDRWLPMDQWTYVPVASESKVAPEGSQAYSAAKVQK